MPNGGCVLKSPAQAGLNDTHDPPPQTTTLQQTMSDHNDQLVSMGFEESRIAWALKATRSAGLQQAMDHLLANSEKPVPEADDEDEPMDQAGGDAEAKVRSTRLSICAARGKALTLLGLGSLSLVRASSVRRSAIAIFNIISLQPLLLPTQQAADSPRNLSCTVRQDLQEHGAGQFPRREERPPELLREHRRGPSSPLSLPLHVRSER